MCQEYVPYRCISAHNMCACMHEVLFHHWMLSSTAWRHEAPYNWVCIWTSWAFSQGLSILNLPGQKKHMPATRNIFWSFLLPSDGLPSIYIQQDVTETYWNYSALRPFGSWKHWTSELSEMVDLRIRIDGPIGCRIVWQSVKHKNPGPNTKMENQDSSVARYAAVPPLSQGKVQSL